MDRRDDIVVCLKQERYWEMQGAGMSSKGLVEEKGAGENRRGGDGWDMT